jgi:hypothetical protein
LAGLSILHAVLASVPRNPIISLDSCQALCSGWFEPVKVGDVFGTMNPGGNASTFPGGPAISPNVIQMWHGNYAL